MMMSLTKTPLPRLSRLMLLVSALASTSLVHADPNLADEAPAAPTASAPADTPSNFHVTGFLSVIGGQVFNGSLPGNYIGPSQINGVNCPCYIADWANGGVYRDNFSLKPESHAGVQVQYNFSPTLNFVGQVVVRGEDTTPNVSWAYFNYKLDDHWEVHAGRQRIPLYYYSPFQDVGFAYPWVSPPPELYGWDATNYNGASLRYTNSFGDNNVTASVFGGEEKVAESGYYKILYAGHTDVSWSDIIGADLELNHGPLTVRAVYLQSNTTTTNPGLSLDLASKLKAYGVAVNLDFDSWFVLSELTQLTRDYGPTVYSYKAPAATIGAGLRLDKWTPFINYATYSESADNPTLFPTSPSKFKRTSLTLRYDIDSNSDIKTQVDHHLDTTSNTSGNVNVVRVSYDRIF